MDSILIVDDVEINRTILKEILEDQYETLEAENGIEALDILFNIAKPPQAVLLDIMMPEMDGFEVLKNMKQNPVTAGIPVLFITAADASVTESRGINEGAVDYISKPFNPDVVKARVNNHIQLRRYRENLEIMLDKKTAELVATHERTLETLATIIEYRSLESGTHIRRTCALTKIMVDHLVRSPLFAGELLKLKGQSIVKAAALHDVGKVGIPDSILLKPGRLTPEEFEVIKRHTVIGGEIIGSIAKDVADDAGYLARAGEIARWHHERWDGKGYPDGLAGTNIPLSARILSVVDVYDALVNDRCYKAAYSHEEALEIINEGGGTQFDPLILKAFLEVSDQIRAMDNAEE